ncbi:unnamed protein product [Cyclocybe aegerita]|uniref:Polyketide synthase n=1 Tax=Cyclocybe aegerita TaxID=1973307 RepID=A0A8S0WZJ5_CYCAE|nr:unnamed protein product [Cyclocybe aegerita]
MGRGRTNMDKQSAQLSAPSVFCLWNLLGNDGHDLRDNAHPPPHNKLGTVYKETTKICAKPGLRACYCALVVITRLWGFFQAQIIKTFCTPVFHAEIDSLSSDVLQKVDICASDFQDKTSLLSSPHARHFSNPAFTIPNLLLTQILRYLSYINPSPNPHICHPPTPDLLQQKLDNVIAVLGVSSGILSACVVAASRDPLSFISFAVQAYRLALWIGIRSQLYRLTLPAPTSGYLDIFPWALVVLGIPRHDLEQSISDFNKFDSDTDRVHITAAIDDRWITVSGHPDDLAAFVCILPEGASVHETSIKALYHCSSKLQTIRDEVLGDASSRKIRFPTFEDLVVPVRSTFSGDVIKDAGSGVTLLEMVVDMILMQPVNWDVVVERVVRGIPCAAEVDIVGVGLGKGILKRLEQAISSQGLDLRSSVDLNTEQTPRPLKVKQEPIAVIGMAINMPGARTPAELWELLLNGTSTVQEIPKDRFDFAEYTEGRLPGRVMKASTANFIAGADEFDHGFFNISPREARSMDPQQRVLLHAAYEALEDAGYVPNSSPSFNPGTFGCFIGASTHDYVHNLRNDVDIYYSPGTLAAFLSGRLSYCLGLSGPSVVVDTACSSSVVAIYQAARALMNRDCNAALAGGVNIISSPDMFLGLDRAHFLAPSGQCKSFDASADGYSRAEGCGVFVLKRLSDAIVENDGILGVIRGVEVNQSGLAASITHPHVPTQEALFNQVLKCSEIDPNSITLVEAHGTGTQAGDKNELESIRRVFASDQSRKGKRQRRPDTPLYVTSIKGNIGHLEAASGSASLAKVLVMLREKKIPRQISFKQLHPRLAPLGPDGIVIPASNVPWLPANHGGPLIALINNFGAAGSNATLVVEEYIPSSSANSCTASLDGVSYVFGLSAKDGPALEALRARYIAWLCDPRNDVSLLDVAYTATARRQLHPFRLAVSASSKEDLIEKLGCTQLDEAPVQETAAPVVFVFSGQGSHYRGTGRSLYISSAIFRRHVDECEVILTSLGFGGVTSMIAGRGSTVQHPMLNDLEGSQPAIFALQYALAKMWLAWGIRPVAVVGHSLGDYAALVIAGVLTLRDALIIVATRARCMLERCTPKETGMVAVGLEPVRMQSILESRKEFTNLSISCFNSPKDCVVSGPMVELLALTDYFDQERLCKYTQLSVPYGFHSAAMSPVLDDLLALGKKTRMHSPLIPVISTVLGRVLRPGDITLCVHDYFARHCIEPVRFLGGIESYLSDATTAGKALVWLEIGPHTAVIPMLKAFPQLSDALLLGTLRKGQDAWASIARTLSSLYKTNSGIDWRKIFAQVGPAKCVSLPSYPFSMKSFWVQFKEDAVGRKIDFSLIRNWVQIPNDGNEGVAILETTIERLRVYIEGHRVAGIPLCPASIYLELVFSGVRLALRQLGFHDGASNISLTQINVPKPLVCVFGEENHTGALQIVINTKNNTFSIKSRTASFLEGLHAEGEYSLCTSDDTEMKFKLLLPNVVRRASAILHPGTGPTTETFYTRTAYQIIFPRVVEYSKVFQTMQSVDVLPNGLEAAASVKFNTSCDGRFTIHPIFLDSLIHVAGFVANLRGGLDHAYICNKISSFTALPTRIDKYATYKIVCRIAELPHNEGIVAESWAVLEADPKILVAHVEGIRFQRVRLSGLKSSLASIAGVSTPSSVCYSEPDGYFSHIAPPDIKTVVLQTIASTCGVDLKQISVEQNLASLGIDPLKRLELCYGLSKAFPAFGYRSEDVSGCRTIGEVVNLITSNPVSEHVPLLAPSNMTSTPRTLVSNGSPLVKRVFAQVLDVEEDAIGDDADLGSLGLDSLSSIEASHIFTNRFQINMPLNFLSPKRTIRDIETQVLSPGNSSSPSTLRERFLRSGATENPVEKMKDALGLNTRLWSVRSADDSRTPLVLIHDGSGLAVSYQRILDLQRPVWAINNPNFSSSRPWLTILQMAESYAAFILEKITGPVIIGGWSFGGVVAFEVAKTLHSRLVPVRGVILIDSPDPFTHISLPPSVIDAVLASSKNLDPEIKSLCKQQFTMNDKLLSKYDPYETRHYGPPPRLIFLRSTDGFKLSPHNQENVPSWLSDRSRVASMTHGWELLAGVPIKVLDIPGNHFQPFEPQNVMAVSQRLSEACNSLDK